MEFFKKIFICSVSIILVLTAVLKLYSCSMEAFPLSREDVVFNFLSLRQLMMLSALVELGVVGMITHLKHSDESVEIIAWLGGLFASYRFFAWMRGATGTCMCMGMFAGRMGDIISKYLLIWIITGASFLLLNRFGGRLLRKPLPR